MIAPHPALQAQRLRITGVVQGVGFRPFVHRLATRHGLAGSVRNVAGEVEIAVEGMDVAISAFRQALTLEAPPLARVESVQVEPLEIAQRTGFVIEQSTDVAGRRQPVSPDAALCAACEAELLDPANRRYRYPFITCTDCGPRFTVIEALPYDRERTSMRRFTQCPECAREYRAPSNRRFHSETNSCSTCGPRLWYEGPYAPAGSHTSDAAIAAAAALLRRGGVLALRGLGGFHLVVDATSDVAVQQLRARKRRYAKPFAVMVRTLSEAADIANVSAAVATLLTSPARPVVVLHRQVANGLSDGIAPGLDSVGILLPSTPLHHLLLGALRRPLVMTSGNLSDEPIAIDNDEARARLGAVADGFLFHDREIVARYDDSVLRITARRAVFLRRARGFAPLPLTLPIPTPRPLIATGPDLKNTFTLAEHGRAYVSQHIGDLDSLETVVHFRDTLQRFKSLFQIVPEVAVCDLHPGYLSTRLAHDLGLSDIIAVQHHHAHIAAVLAEHGETGPVIGVAYDGTGYGDDGHTWGAELLLADLTAYRRLAHLRYAPMPGGDLAAREPWRAALGYLSLEPTAAAAFAHLSDDVPARECALAEAQIARRLNAPLASSMGRLFDAASTVLGLHSGRQYEGEAAMKLEALAGDRAGHALDMPIVEAPDGTWTFDPVPLLVGLGERRRHGADPADLAADFHDSIVATTTRLVCRARERTGVGVAALGGGVFQNTRLSDMLAAALEAQGLRVLLPRMLSPNDGAVSYGQAAVAAARLARTGHPVDGGAPCV